jgi:hypothetical protein
LGVKVPLVTKADLHNKRRSPMNEHVHPIFTELLQDILLTPYQRDDAGKPLADDRDLQGVDPGHALNDARDFAVDFIRAGDYDEASTEYELAAVLCLELGKRRVGRQDMPVRDGAR